jgi:hypothetical protein
MTINRAMTDCVDWQERDCRPIKLEGIRYSPTLSREGNNFVRYSIHINCKAQFRIFSDEQLDTPERGKLRLQPGTNRIQFVSDRMEDVGTLKWMGGDMMRWIKLRAYGNSTTWEPSIDFIEWHTTTMTRTATASLWTQVKDQGFIGYKKKSDAVDNNDHYFIFGVRALDMINGVYVSKNSFGKFYLERLDSRCYVAFTETGTDALEEFLIVDASSDLVLPVFNLEERLKVAIWHDYKFPDPLDNHPKAPGPLSFRWQNESNRILYIDNMETNPDVQNTCSASTNPYSPYQCVALKMTTNVVKWNGTKTEFAPAFFLIMGDGRWMRTWARDTETVAQSSDRIIDEGEFRTELDPADPTYLGLLIYP